MGERETLLYRLRASGKITVALVFSAMFLDNMLLTVVVPIIPDYLYKLDQAQQESEEISTDPCLHLFLSFNLKVNFTKNVTQPPPSLSLIPYSIVNENGKTGLLLASKAFVQLISGLFIGSISNRIGYHVILITGTVVLFSSSLIFAFGNTFVMLFLARSIQGIASASIAISGMGMVAERYCDDGVRSRMMGVAMGGIAAGVLAGYPFGSTLYDFVGKMAPFLILSGLIIIAFALQVAILTPYVQTEKPMVTIPIKRLVCDPYVLLTVGAVCVSTSAIAILEPCLPIWLMENLAPPRWQLGTVFIPDSVGYFIGTNFFGPVACKIGRWLTAMVALFIVGISSITIPLTKHMLHLLVPHLLLGLGIGIVDAALMPMLAHLVDLRYSGTYGSVYALAQIAVSLAYCLGPIVGSHMVRTVGFPWVMRGIGIVNLVYCPFCFFLRRLQAVGESKAIVLETETKPCYLATTRGNSRLYSRFVDDGQED